MSSWTVYHTGEPIRCPARINGRACNRAQDVVGRATTAYIRVWDGPIIGGLERECRTCHARLAIVIQTEIKHEL